MAGFIPPKKPEPEHSSVPLQYCESYHHRIEVLKQLASPASKSVSSIGARFLALFTSSSSEPIGRREVHAFCEKLSLPMHKNLIWAWIERGEIERELNAIFEGLVQQVSNEFRWRTRMREAEDQDAEFIARQFKRIDDAARTGLYHIAFMPFASIGSGPEGYKDATMRFSASNPKAVLNETVAARALREAAEELYTTIDNLSGTPVQQIKAVRVRYTISNDSMGDLADLDDPEAMKNVARHAFPPDSDIETLVSFLCRDAHVTRNSHTDVQVYTKRTNFKPHLQRKTCGGVVWERQRNRRFMDLSNSPTTDQLIDECETIYVVNKMHPYTIVVLTEGHRRGSKEVGKLLDLTEGNDHNQHLRNEYNHNIQIPFHGVHILHINGGQIYDKVADGLLQEYQCNIRVYPVQ